jgi:hypothetical protein
MTCATLHVSLSCPLTHMRMRMHKRAHALAGATLQAPHGPPRPPEVVRLPDPGAPHPPGVLVTLSKRKFMEVSVRQYLY